MYEASLRTARKAHVCYECARNIEKGERYESVAGVWNGEFSVYKTCPHCLSLREFVSKHVPCFCFGHGNIREDAIETARGYGWETPGLLFGAWRREIAIRRAKNLTGRKRNEPT